MLKGLFSQKSCTKRRSTKPTVAMGVVAGDSATKAGTKQKQPQLNTFFGAMGIQAQKRKGSIKSSKSRALPKKRARQHDMHGNVILRVDEGSPTSPVALLRPRNAQNILKP